MSSFIAPGSTMYEEIMAVHMEESSLQDGYAQVEEGEVVVGQLNDFESRFITWLMNESKKIIQEEYTKYLYRLRF